MTKEELEKGIKLLKTAIFNNKEEKRVFEHQYPGFSMEQFEYKDFIYKYLLSKVEEDLQND